MKNAIKEVITSLADRLEQDLLSLPESDLAGQWYFEWDNKASIAWNIYQFSDMFELHRRRCRRWEEHHNGFCCVVERVRDKYLMPRVRAFEAELTSHIAAKRGGETPSCATCAHNPSDSPDACDKCIYAPDADGNDASLSNYWEAAQEAAKRGGGKE